MWRAVRGWWWVGATPQRELANPAHLTRSATSPPRCLAASPPADGKLDVLEIKKRVTATKIHAMGVHKSITALNVFEVGDADDDK